MAATPGRRAVCLFAGRGALAVSEDHVPFSEPCFTTGNDVLFVFYVFLVAMLCVCVYVCIFVLCNVTCCTCSVLYMYVVCRSIEHAA